MFESTAILDDNKQSKNDVTALFIIPFSFAEAKVVTCKFETLEDAIEFRDKSIENGFGYRIIRWCIKTWEPLQQTNKLDLEKFSSSFRRPKEVPKMVEILQERFGCSLNRAHSWQVIPMSKFYICDITIPLWTDNFE